MLASDWCQLEFFPVLFKGTVDKGILLLLERKEIKNNFRFGS